MLKTVSITVKGKVQGVFFRQSAQERANELGVTGEVENLRDGSVHITATGTEQQLATFADWCKKGPRRAEVSTAEVRELTLKQFEHFTITRS